MFPPEVLPRLGYSCPGARCTSDITIASLTQFLPPPFCPPSAPALYTLSQRLQSQTTKEARHWTKKHDLLANHCTSSRVHEPKAARSEWLQAKSCSILVIAAASFVGDCAPPRLCSSIFTACRFCYQLEQHLPLDQQRRKIPQGAGRNRGRIRPLIPASKGWYC